MTFARTIWWGDGSPAAPVIVIDQRKLPHEATTVRWTTVQNAADGIRSMEVRGAPLIGVSAAYGMALAMRADPSDAALERAGECLAEARPTAVNLRWAVDRVAAALREVPIDDRPAFARELADRMADEDVAACRRIGEAGLEVLREIHAHTGRPVQVLTHCNAGWLACVELGTVLAPVYLAHAEGLPLHVWVSETRPRNQGASLTTWELGQGGVPHTLIVDNAAGHLLRSGQVDVVITGADRIAANGDVANKVGTYLKAVAARDAGVPFLTAAPASTFDAACPDGDAIPIEERGEDEVLLVNGTPIAPEGTRARNWAFDVTPARLVDGYLTDRGHLAPGHLEPVLR